MGHDSDGEAAIHCEKNEMLRYAIFSDKSLQK